MGIGTNNPQAKLDITNGGINITNSFPIQISGSDINHGLKYKRSNPDGNLIDGPYLYGWLGGSLGAKHNDTEIHVINWKDNGNVGIGVSNPTRTLSVQGDIYALGMSAVSFQDDARFTVTNTNVPSMNIGSVSMPHYGIVAPGEGQSAALWLSGSAGIRMFTAGNPNPQFNLLSNGNVGIGTNNPHAKLDVFFNNEQKYMKFYQPDGGNPINSMIASLRYNWYNDVADIGIVRGGSGDILGLGFSINNQEYFRIANNGNVGIGTTNPQSKLDVNNGNIHVLGNNITIEQGYGNSSNLVLSQPGKVIWNITNEATTGNFLIGNGSGTQFWISPSGSNVNAALNGKLEAKEVKVTLTPTADFVFEKTYELPKLGTIEKFVKENKHLPEVASASEMKKNGVNIGEFQIKLLQKIEELTLYTIEQNKLNEKQSELIKLQSEKIQQLEKDITNLKNK